jgi:putative flippase GtrA
MFTELIKFCFVGGSGVLVDFGTTWLLKEKIHINRYIANSCGFIVAASTNYLLNRLWTFHSNNPQILKEYLLFFGISLLGLAIKQFLSLAFLRKSGFTVLVCRGAKLRFLLFKLIAIAIVTVWKLFYELLHNIQPINYL